MGGVNNMETKDEQTPAPAPRAALAPLPPPVQVPLLPTHTTVLSSPQYLHNHLLPVMNGQWFYMIPSYQLPVMGSFIPPVNTKAPQKTKFHRQSSEQSVTYVKKPPNAFMLYRQEQRPKVVAEFGNPDCAVVNKVIGERWKSMTQQEQDKYHEEAEKERRRHYKLHPEWSAAENYGKKRKRIRRKVLVEAEETEI